MHLRTAHFPTSPRLQAAVIRGPVSYKKPSVNASGRWCRSDFEAPLCCSSHAGCRRLTPRAGPRLCPEARVLTNRTRHRDVPAAASGAAGRRAAVLAILRPACFTSRLGTFRSLEPLYCPPLKSSPISLLPQITLI